MTHTGTNRHHWSVCCADLTIRTVVLHVCAHLRRLFSNPPVIVGQHGVVQQLNGVINALLIFRRKNRALSDTQGQHTHTHTQLRGLW